MSEHKPISEARLSEIEERFASMKAEENGYRAAGKAIGLAYDIPDLVAELRRMREPLKEAAKLPCVWTQPPKCTGKFGDQKQSAWCLPCFARHILGDRTEETG